MLIRTLRSWFKDQCDPPPPVTFGDIRKARTIILVYNTMWGQLPGLTQGEVPEGCAITTERGYWNRAQAVVFHLPTLCRLPLRKPLGQRWVAWSKECRENYPLHQKPDYLRKFDLFMTYERNADVVSPYYGYLAARRFRSPPEEKSEFLCSFVSSEVNQSGRVEFLRELMEHVPVHCYGKLFQNRQLAQDKGADTRKQIYSRYKFVLGLENAVAPDYVTEKFYEPLEAGSITVYRGAPNVSQFSPAPRCFVNANDFASPKLLAEFLLALADNQERYNEWMLWRQRPFLPEFEDLLSASRESTWSRLCKLVDGPDRKPPLLTSVGLPSQRWWVRESWQKAAARLAWKQLPLVFRQSSDCWPYRWDPPFVGSFDGPTDRQQAQVLPLWQFLETARRIRADFGSTAQGAQSGASPSARRGELSLAGPDPSEWTCEGPGWFRTLLLPECSPKGLRSGIPVLVGVTAETRSEALDGLLAREQKWWAWCVDDLPDSESLRALRSAERVFAANEEIANILSSVLGRRVVVLAPAVQPKLHHPGRSVTLMGLPDAWHELACKSAQIDLREPWQERKRLVSLSYQIRRHHSVARRIRLVGLGSHSRSSVSVLCCTRRPSCLENLLRSFSRQRYLSKELILVAHGVRLPEKQILRSLLEEKGLSLQILTAPPDWSLGRCLQWGSEHASGAYIARFDDDDYYGPGYLEHMVAYLEDSQSGAVGKNTFPILFAESGTNVCYKPGRELEFTILESGATMMYRREVLELGVTWPGCSRAEDIGFSSNCWVRGIPQLAVDPFDYLCLRGPSHQHTWTVDEARLSSLYPPFSERLNLGDTDY